MAAMYENRGYCPYNELMKFNIGEKISDKWQMTRNILKDRLSYIVYSKEGYSYKGAYIIDALKYETGVLGIQVACTLENFIPNCKCPDVGIPIICTDVLNPYQIPVNIQEKNGWWNLITEEIDVALHQDEKYLIVIQKNNRKYVCISIKSKSQL